MDTFVHRTTIRYQLPLQTEKYALRPENTILDFSPINSRGDSRDIGSLCYLNRDAMQSSQKGKKVDLSSFNRNRAREVRKLIQHFSDQFEHSGLKPITLSNYCYEVLKFIDWCDQNGHAKVLSGERYARKAFADYSNHLKRLANQHQIIMKSAARHQRPVLDFLEDYFGIHYSQHDPIYIKQNHNSNEPTTIPDDTTQEKVLTWANCIFEGFSDLLLLHKPYPYALSVPSFLSIPDNRLWIFPLTIWCRPPGNSYKQDFYAYDFGNGRIRTAQEIEEMFGAKLERWKCTEYPKRAYAQIARANADPWNFHRIERGMMAVQAFFLLFIANTGQNPTPVSDLPWGEDLENSVRDPLVERQGFRTIKYRAGGREVAFEIGIRFMPLLKRYLDLRKHLLKENHFPYLFFSYGKASEYLKSGPIRMGTTSIDKFLSILKAKGLLTKSLSARQLRAAKADYINRTAGTVVAATMLQHSVQTAENHYANGSEVIHQVEIGAFLESVERTVLDKGQKILGAKNKACGTCIAPDSPNPIIVDPVISPDCIRPEGCLFCDKYRIHADATDVQKLLSARYCIRLIKRSTESQEQFERLFGAVLQRIEAILETIKGKGDVELVEAIEEKVDKYGELSAFWTKKLDTLMELELV